MSKNFKNGSRNHEKPKGGSITKSPVACVLMVQESYE